MRSYHEQDYYELLELKPDASQEEISAAYERLKSVFAESSSATFMLFGEDEAAAMREMLDEAFSTLSDAQARIAYDDRIGVKKAQPLVSSASTSSTARFDEVPSVTMPGIDPAGFDHIERDDDEEDEEEETRIEVKAAEVKAPETKAPEKTPEPVREAAHPMRRASDRSELAPVQAAQAPAPVEERRAEPEAVAEPRQHFAMVQSPPPDELNESMEYGGQVLARLRENRGITIEAIAQRTKITLTHLRAIEANQYDKLPARVYVRGFVTQYAKFLGLPGDRVAESYLQIYDRFFQTKS